MITDTNVFLSRWPCRRLPDDETAKLVAKLKSQGVTQAWAGSFDALLHNDVRAVNARLADECRTHAPDMLLPFGAVNPTLSDWQEDVRRCAREHGFRGIRLHPNYHGYDLSDKRFVELLDLAGKYKLIVQITLKMEDERTQHRLLQVPQVDTAPLAGLLAEREGLKVVLTNSMRTLRGASLEKLAALGNVTFEISMLEGVGGIGKLITQVPYQRILFGSYAPFFYLESAVLKLRESELGDFVRKAITHENAAALLAR